MNTRVLGAFLVVIGLTVLASDVVEGHKRHRGGVSVSIEDDDVTSCADLKVTFHGLLTARAEEERVLPGASVSRLEVRPHENGGAYIRGWDRSDYSITACKAAGDEDEAAAERQLADVRLVVSGNRVSIVGPDDDNWVGYLLIRAPQNTSLDAETMNGPLTLRDIAGKADLRATNGPISLENTRGEVRADVTNGPVNIEGSAGRLNVNAQNGPLNVCLKGERWDGELDAHTENGPINLEVPAGYQSGVRVDASRHSPVECDAPQCRQAVRTWENPNRIEFGGTSPVVRLSTVNGPVSIGGGKAKRKEL